MRLSIALSGEEVTKDLLASFDGVGLVRSEYLFRDAQVYPTPTSAREVMGPYVLGVSMLADDKPVWYRTLEVTTAEANVLRGVEAVIDDEPNLLMGLRGIRRSLAYPSSLWAELEVLAGLKAKNVGVVAPFVSEVAELEWFVAQVIDICGRATPIACMVETPAAVLLLPKLLDCGIQHVIVGCNDLSSLVNAQARRLGNATELSDALVEALKIVRQATASRTCTMAVAGYLSPGLLSAIEGIGADEAVVHYCDLPGVLGQRFASLPDLDHVMSVKKLTRRAIAARSQSRARE